MTLTIVRGWMGTGKTLLATYFASKEARPVYANYNIDIPNYRELKPEMLSELTEPSLVIIDESYTWLESRKSMQNLSIYMSYILFQSRKRGIDFILTVQELGTVDLRFRNFTEYLIDAEKMKDGSFEYTVRRGLHDKNPFKMIMPPTQAQQLFPLFDTMQMVNPIDDYMVSDIAQSPEVLNSKLDELAQTIMKIFEGKKITKAVVKDYCIREKIPAKYGDLVYNRILTTKMLDED